MSKRKISLYVAVCLLFSSILYRVISLNYSSYADAGVGYSSKTIIVGRSRGNIYDVNMKKLVNKEEKLFSVAKPGAYSFEYISSMKDKDKSKALISQLSNGLPVMFENTEKISSDDFETFSVMQRYEDNDFLCHVIGYVDASDHGVCGIEKAYDEFLTQASGSLSVTFETDANGRVLSGIVPTIKDSNMNSPAGVILTVDSDIQHIAEEAMRQGGIENGACVILSANDASISAMVSLPSFSRENLSQALSGDGSPMMNKALCAYSVGSVFKPVIACAALENGIKTDFGHECTGQTDINGTVYICNRRTSHGKMDLKSALEMSCNTYFVKLSEEIDAGVLYDFCTGMGFSVGTHLCDTINSDPGSFPDEKELENKGKKANISFGQGSLTATPIQMAAAYLAIANDGYYKYPYLIKGTVDGYGNVTPAPLKPDSKVMSATTAKTVRDDLISVVENGNAYNAECDICKVAGKTGTAQSGSYNANGTEILRTWFVGFFPADAPLYCVAILDENGKSGAADCAPVFSTIAQNTMEMLIDRSNR